MKSYPLFITVEPLTKRIKVEEDSDEDDVMIILDSRETVAEPTPTVVFVDYYVTQPWVPISPVVPAGHARLSVYASLHSTQQNPSTRMDPRLQQRGLKITNEVLELRRNHPVYNRPTKEILLVPVEEHQLVEQVNLKLFR